MTRAATTLRIAGAGALLLAVAGAAAAQDGNAIGNPQLRNFQLQPQRRIVAEPAPAPVRTPPVVAPPAPTPAPQTNTATPRQTPPPQGAPQGPATAPPPTASRPAPRQAPPPVQENAPPPSSAAPALSAPPSEPVVPATPVPEQATPAPEPETAPPPAPPQGGISWLYLLPVALVALGGAAFLLRRRRRVADEEFADAPAAVPLASPPPPPPVLRPWLELALRVEKASATLTDTVLSFELEIANIGKAAARNLRVDVKMFNAGDEQDREIGAFFQTAGRETTKLNLPGIAAGNSGVIRGEVAMKRDDMRALVLEDKYLFVPVLAVNVLYDWGQGRTGQSSKSYVVGRELAEPGEKMGAFRVDQGPRVWRTVGQRQHTMALRV